MKQSVKGWQWVIATVAIVALLIFVGMRAFAPAGKLSEAIPAGPTPVIEGEGGH